MAITNQTKSSTTIARIVKHFTGGYGFAKYGMSFYGSSGSLVNLAKSSYAYLWSANVFPWQEALPWQFTGGGPAVTNQTKNLGA